MRSRLSLGAAIAAVVVALAVLSMHAVDAHPADDLQTGRQTAVTPLAAAPAAAPAAPHAGHEHHAHHDATPDPIRVSTATGPQAGEASAAASGSSQPGHGGHGHSDAFAHHVALCAAVILGGLAALYRLRRARRLPVHVARRLIGTAPGLDPPVPRLALALR